MTIQEKIAMVCFEAFQGGNTVTLGATEIRVERLPRPAFSDLGMRQRVRWVSAAEAVMKELDAQLQEVPEKTLECLESIDKNLTTLVDYTKRMYMRDS